MTTKFFDSFLVAGIGEELIPDGVKKNLLCGVRDIVLVQGEIPPLKELLQNIPHADSKLKWIRFMTLSKEKDLHLVIKYANPFHAEDNIALYGFELVRGNGGDSPDKVQPTRGVLVHTTLATEISTIEDIFE